MAAVGCELGVDVLLGVLFVVEGVEAHAAFAVFGEDEEGDGVGGVGFEELCG